MPFFRMPHYLLPALLLVLAPASSQAGPIYRWVDALGQTHFTAQPPESAAVEVVNIGTGTSSHTGSSAPQPTAAAPTASPDQATINQQVQQQVNASEAARQDYCVRLRTNLAQLQINPRIRVEENGEVRRIGEEERQQRLDETRKLISEHCQ